MVRRRFPMSTSSSMRVAIWATRAACTAARARTSRAAGVVAAATERSILSGASGWSTLYSIWPTLIRLAGLRKIRPDRLAQANSERRATSSSMR
ncbi:hypothetical protein AAW14_29765 [Streptomyces hygroscopicus]|nr:hypothetical protein [Streptomyces hygroscopicus]